MTVPKKNLKEIKKNLKDKALDEEALIRASDEGMIGGEPSDLQDVSERIEQVEELQEKNTSKLKKVLKKANFKSAKKQSAAALGEMD